MSDFTFVSGWAGRADLYPEFAERGEFLVPFVDHAPQDIAERLLCGGGTLVGWSTGAHIILRDIARLAPLYEQITLVAPFYIFTRCLLTGTVEKMIANMERFPERTVRGFYRNCGIRDANASWAEGAVEPLLDGLRFLLESRAQLPAEGHFGNVLVIGGLSDKIVPLSEAVGIAGKLEGALYRSVSEGHFMPARTIAGVVHEATGRRIL
ncbi:hypothetical protein GGQ74_000799 [Desulfobaculum xiamenense]|uniref:Pimeloyl-[acyl-carrier protein] methyl ester esterase n=1 Tax=Desulfobaculum xiamenense TaxID=995050 RepID=A0A846QR74_9BACT|nr:hypothetical protein [Desulfobaculum xiamenense]NJB67159.1 hypothetical protein [Desulfobaculum xiamenense]